MQRHARTYTHTDMRTLTAGDRRQFAAYAVGNGEHALLLGERQSGLVTQMFELHHMGSRVTHFELPETEDVVAVDYGMVGSWLLSWVLLARLRPGL